MKCLLILIKRNTKLFFKDKGMFFSSMITPLILILLYSTFLANIYKDTFMNFIPESVNVSNKVINGFVSSWLISSLLAVCTITISFCSNLLMIQDKHTNVREDFNVSPVKKSTLALGYFISSCIVTLIVCYIAMIVGFIYIACVGWYLSVSDVLLIILDVFILTLFGTSLSSIVNFFLTTQGQMSAVGTIVSCAYGFICGAYTPINQFDKTLQNILMFLPSTYGTSMIHNHFLRGVLKELNIIFPSEVISSMKQNFDLELKFFNMNVSNLTSFLIISITTILLIGIYVLMNILDRRKLK